MDTSDKVDRMVEIYLLPFLFFHRTDPTTPDKRTTKPPATFARQTADKPNTLDDVTKPENKSASTSITKRMNVNDDELQCPTEREAKFELFPMVCNNNQDCERVGGQFRCCKLFGSKRCHEGFEKPLEDIEHERKLMT